MEGHVIHQPKIKTADLAHMGMLSSVTRLCSDFVCRLWYKAFYFADAYLGSHLELLSSVQGYRSLKD